MKKTSGKVRDIYEINENELIIVTTDRISAFDIILPVLIRDKGKILTQISSFWFEYTKDIIPNQIISTDEADFPEYFKHDEFFGRTVIVKKLKMLPYEFIVRGYIFGSMWDAYIDNKAFCGYQLNDEYTLAQKLKKPILTPSIKNKEGHDEAVSINHMEDDLGKALADKLTSICIALYERCCEHAFKNGIIIADTKFEFGFDEENNLILADEIFTPDSSRFWSKEAYAVGQSPKSYDKQFLRDWLIENEIAGKTPIPDIPANIIEETEKKYRECARIIL